MVPLWKHIRAVLILPFMVTIVVPTVILLRTSRPGSGLPGPDSLPFPMLGLVYIGIGLWLLIRTNVHFARSGDGTLAPWDKTSRLVVTGVYRYVRNPMISGVLFILLGEATFFGSKRLLFWFLIFLVINMIYIPLVEERDLERRFGEEYQRYTTNVPRWVPRIKPWDPE